MQSLKNYIAEIPDFPEKDVLFRDISPLLKTRFPDAIDALSALYSPQEWETIDVLAGIDARGFIFASALAYKHKKGVVTLRKQGKLPHVGSSIHYGLEYGKSCLEMQRGEGRVLIIDDVLATGGTLTAAAELCTQNNYNVMGFAVLLDLKYLNNFTWNGLLPRKVLTYE